MTVGIAFVSLWESPKMPESVSVSDKVIHGLMYLVLAVTWILPIYKITHPKSHIKRSIFVCLFVTLYGALMELLQHFCTQTRSGDWKDILADFIGALIGVAPVLLFRHYKRNKS